MTNKQIDTVEQDERAAWRDHPAALDAKALATAQEIALMWGRDRSQFVSRIQVAVRDAMDWVRAASTSANVAQGAEAVATVKVYETYTGQNGWTEVAQEEYDRTKDKYEHRIRRVPAPPAQTAITDDARDAARYRWLRDGEEDVFCVFGSNSTWGECGHIEIYGDRLDEHIDAALTAAQSASGDTK